MIAYWERGSEWMGDELQLAVCPSFTGPTSLAALDVSGRSSHGTLTNMDRNTSWQTSGGKGALDFTTSSTHVLTPSVLLGTIHTTSVWVSPRGALAFNFNALNGDNTGSNLCSMAFSSVTSGVDQMAYSFSSTSVSTTIPNILNLWSHCVSVRTGNTVAFFLNGSFINSATAAINAAFSPNRFGQRASNGVTFNGTIDDYRLHSRALTAPEIRQLYERDRGGGMLYQPPKRRSVFIAAGFRAYWHRRQSQLIGGGL